MQSMIPKKLLFLDIFAGILIACALAMVFLYAPIETSMGLVQKVFYFHMSYAWIGMLSFVAAGVFSILYLLKANSKFDLASESAVEIGLIFTLIAIASGSIWAKPIWNTWWTWDPRLTTTTIMALIYAGSIFLRQSLDDPDKKGRLLAIYCIIGCASVPLTFFSIRGYRSIHPVILGGSSGGMNMTPEMIQTMIFSMIAFTVLYLALLGHRYLYAKLREETETTKFDLEDVNG
ncbi:MAG: cytochrome c biogenesis protein [Flexilinea sp.]